MPHLDEIDAGHGADELARLLADALGVGEVACVLVGDAHFDVAVGRRQSNLRQPLGQVLDAAFEARDKNPSGERHIRPSRPPARRSSRPVDMHVRVAQARRSFEVAVVGEERAAAPFTLRKPHLAAGKLQQPDGGVM